MKIRAQVVSQQGQSRHHNEDRYHMDPDQALYMVADGMGGHRRGEVAASMAIDIIKKELKDKADLFNKTERKGKKKEKSLALIGDCLEEAFYLANQAIWHYARRHPDHQGMGTTLSALYLWQGYCSYLHIGDSRLYRFGKEGYQQITQDHTMVQEFVQSGSLSSLEAKKHPKKNVLLRALGTEEEASIDRGFFPLEKGQTLLLATDGLYESLGEDRLHGWIRAYSPEQLRELIEEEILRLKPKDDATALILSIEEVDHV